MTPQDLVYVILGDEPRIVGAVSSGAGWEIWMQVEFAIECRRRDWQVAREIPYGNSGYVLDFLLRDQQGGYAVEMKVESATNAGVAVLPAFKRDVEKLATYPGSQQVNGGYALAIAYSDKANGVLSDYAGQDQQNRLYAKGGTIGVLVQLVALS